MPDVTLQGITMHYEDVCAAPDAPPLLLIAGLASDSASWLPVVETLSARYRLIMPDNRACGRTRPLDAPTGLKIMAEDCRALLSALEIERAHVLGHSMGGMVALHLAADHPGLVDKLVVAASSPKGSARNKELFATLAAMRRAGLSEDLWHRALFVWLFKRAFFEVPDAVENAVALALAYPHRQPQEAFERQLTAVMSEPAPPALEKIGSETLILCGEEDLLFAPAEIAESLAGIAKSRQAVMNGAAHSVYWDDPSGFCRHVMDFLD